MGPRVDDRGRYFSKENIVSRRLRSPLLQYEIKVNIAHGARRGNFNCFSFADGAAIQKIELVYGSSWIRQAMATLQNLSTALLGKIADCNEVDLAAVKQFQARLQEMVGARRGYHGRIQDLVPDYKESGCWDAKTQTALITEFQLARQYFSDYGDVEYGGSTHCWFSLAYTYKDVSVEIYYKKSQYNRYHAADCEDDDEWRIFYPAELEDQFGIRHDVGANEFYLYDKNGDEIKAAAVSEDDPRRLAYHILEYYCDDFETMCYE